jgi:protoheme IX farnesyltransferase
LRAQWRDCWSLIKGPQTGLLLFTGVAGYASIGHPVFTWYACFGLAGSLFLAISGSTVLNMVYDRDIDARMCRTAPRPLPVGRLQARKTWLLGLGLTLLGVGWSVALSPPYGLVVLAGVLLDVVIYTIWLKRRTSWSIIWGGIAGGMPVLAGRTLGVGSVDLLGVLLALAVLLWIPSHILTFSTKYASDYRRVGIPVFPNTHGPRLTRIILAASTAAAAATMVLIAHLLGLQWGYLWTTAVLATLLVGMALASLVRPSPDLNHGLFKFASIYMVGSMGLIAVG